jgi:alkanesulfonate monooxygenase SsuD/methylene tetrahydromethanopterin reductase-like flavin-dependent oxidoreductase (luciferase family)
VRFSIWPINQQRYPDLLAVCQHADRTGWDGVWMSDHLLPSSPPLDRPVLECWTTVTTLLATLPRVRVGTLVSSNTFRHPGVLAKIVGTLAHIAGDRLILGLGAGWQVNEHEAYGIELPTPRERLARLDEACTLIRALLAGGPVDYAGTYYSLKGATAEPATGVPLCLGVKGDRAIQIAARHADEWNLWGLPETVRERGAVLDAACERLGRDPAEIRRSAQALLCVGEPANVPGIERWRASGLPMLTGSPEAITQRIGDFRDAGLDELIIPDFTLGDTAAKPDAMDAFMTDIAMEFRDQ